jgi:arginase
MAIDVLWAGSNLGLRPPEPGSVPGTGKAPEAIREAGLLAALGGRALDAGSVIPGRYRAAPLTGERLRNETELVSFTDRLADRVDESLGAGRAPLVVGGDCSLVLAPLLALRRRGLRVGLVYLDGHGDFRHPGNSDEADTLGGEALAAAVGLHVDAVSDPGGLRPLVRPGDAVMVGCRDDEVDEPEMRAVLGDVVPARDLLAHGVRAAAERIRAVVAAAGLDGFWLHVDVDVLDPRWMPAVDSPDPVGIDPDGLIALLDALAADAFGADLTIFDPDLDEHGVHAFTVVSVAHGGLSRLGERARPLPPADPVQRFGRE